MNSVPPATPRRPLLFLSLVICLQLLGVKGESYVLVELEPVERNIVKRQVQYAEPVQQQPQQALYVPQPAPQPQQLSPEYVAYLQQLQAAQQGQAQQPVDLTQVLLARGPQRFTPPQQLARRPPPPRVSLEERRLQEALAQRQLRTQEREDINNQQLLAQGINPAQLRRERLRQSAQRLAAQQAEEQAARQAFEAQEQAYQALYGQQQQLVQPQLVPVPQEIPVQPETDSSTPAPQRISYSQVAFGTTKLPQPKFPGRPGQQLVYSGLPAQQPAYQRQAQPQPQQQVVYQPQYVYSTLPQSVREGKPQQPAKKPTAPSKQQAQQLFYPQPQPQQEQVVRAEPQYVYATQQVRAPASTYPQGGQTVLTYQPERTLIYQQARPQLQAERPAVQYHPRPQAEVTQKQTPDQYLIETTRHQEDPSQHVVTIPRRQQLTYRPEAEYQELQAALADRQQEAHLAQQQAEAAAAAATTPPPRSAIYVTTARTPVPKQHPQQQQVVYQLQPEYKLQQREGEAERPLTQNELTALINAGFRAGPEGQHGLTSEEEYVQEYYRGLNKRQNGGSPARPKIGKVPLSEEEKQLLAKNGIRNLYRVQSAESNDSPVTYVLAVENQKRHTDKSSSKTSSTQ